MQPTKTPQSSTTLCGRRITPFGAVENPALLETLGDYDHVYRMDLLDALRPIWGESITKYRSQLYKLVSGTCSDTELQQYLRFYYLRFPAFTNFMTREYYFGNQNKPLLRRIIEPARERISNYVAELEERGINVLGQHMDYLYFTAEGNPPALKGVETVC